MSAKGGMGRSVGGANPYITVFSRTGGSRTSIDSELDNIDIHELPSARGCTYVVPREHFALALRVAQGRGESAEVAMAKKYLGVTDAELVRLQEAVIRALEGAPLDPKEIKDTVGDAARSLGDEGKKRGMSSTLPMVLGELQTHGEIRRIPQNGRLDQQRYKYALWRPNPLQRTSLSYEEALTELGELYFQWIGPASIANFQWFTGATAKLAKDTLASLGLKPIEEESELLVPGEQREQFEALHCPKEPHYNLVASLDSLILLRRDHKSLLAPEDAHRETVTDKAVAPINSLPDLFSNAIIDRGRIIGLWEYDPSAGSIVWVSFVGRNQELTAAVEKTEVWIREELSDCRSFSLDSPDSRRPKLEFLRAGGM